ncbi:patatin-like phospholipase family protein [bacterium]|nr:patatin-like phospholipase family protein [bacterium]
MSTLAALQKKDGIALVLSGGATKAFYFHLGVLKALGDHLPVTSIVGSSAGSIIGGFLASGATVETLMTSLYQKQVYIPKFDRWIKTLTSSMLFKPRYTDITYQGIHTSYASLRFLLSLPMLYNRDMLSEAMDRLIASQSKVAGFLDGTALEEMFKSLLPSFDFAATDIDLYVTATALDTNTRAVFNGLYTMQDEDNDFVTDVPIHKAIRASSAVPGMFEPVLIKGRYYIDGEVKRTLSADIGVQLADTVIMSHTYQPLLAHSNGTPGAGSVRDMGWINVLKQSLNIVLHERIERWRQSYEPYHPGKTILWIYPEQDDVAFFQAPEFSFRPEVQQLMIASGERAARRALDKTPI